MKKLALLASAAAFMATASPVLADQFDYGSFSQLGLGQNITITSPTSEGVSAGMIQLIGAGPNLGQSLDAWCVDLFDHLQAGAIYNIVPLTNAGAGAPNPILTNTQISEMGSLMLHGTTSVLGDTFGLNGSAAFQLAIWGVEYGGTLLDNASGPLAALVTQLIANVEAGGIWQCDTCTVDLLDAPAQNQVLAFGVEPTATPIPGAIWGFASAIGGAFLAMRNRKRKQKSAWDMKRPIAA